jgi:hypothetical protein
MSFFQYAVDLIVHIFPHLFFQKIKPWFLDIKLNMIKKPTIATLRISQWYSIFQHTVIETCFKMLKSSKHKKLWRYSNINFILLLNSKYRGPCFIWTFILHLFKHLISKP